MSATFITSCLLSALLLGGSEPSAAARPAKPAAVTTSRPGQGELVQVTYPVADLVVPISPAPCATRAGTADLLREVLARPKGPARQADCEAGRPLKTTEARLMKLIRNTVAPASWRGRGGPGRMEYQPTGLGLVVYQTQDVQEQVGDLLAALRRLQDLEVAVEVRLVSVSEAFCERLGTDVGVHLGTAESAGQDAAFLDEGQLRQLLQAAQEDRQSSALQSPRLTVFNGQKANVDLTTKRFYVTDLKAVREGDQTVVVPRNKAFDTGFRFSVRPVMSADRRFVQLNFAASLTELETPAVPAAAVTTHLRNQSGPDGREHVVAVRQFVQQPSLQTMAVAKSFAVADGKTAVLLWGSRPAEVRTEFDCGPPVLSSVPYLGRLFTNVGYARQAQKLLLLITPRVIINEQEEQTFLGKAAPVAGR
jgi:general secretion pathway protein D